LFVQVRINGDVALLKGIMKEVLEAEDRRPGQVLDHEFINRYTTGFQAFKEALRKEHLGDILEQAGVTKVKIEDAGRIFVESERVIFCWAMGVTQHKNAVANIQEIVNLMLLRGQMGKPGAGFCPSAATVTCRAIAPWVFGSSRARSSSTSSARNSISNHPGNMVTTRCTQSRRCMKTKRKSFSHWAEIFSRRRPILNTPLRLCGAVV
jgi:anaerobic selenocysteine-containing dehydrogenase